MPWACPVPKGYEWSSLSWPWSEVSVLSQGLGLQSWTCSGSRRPSELMAGGHPSTRAFTGAHATLRNTCWAHRPGTQNQAYTAGQTQLSQQHQAHTPAQGRDVCVEHMPDADAGITMVGTQSWLRGTKCEQETPSPSAQGSLSLSAPPSSQADWGLSVVWCCCRARSVRAGILGVGVGEVTPSGPVMDV